MSSRLISVVGVTESTLHRLGLAHYHRGLLHRRDGELEVKNRGGVRSDGHRLLLGIEAGFAHRDLVIADRHR